MRLTPRRLHAASLFLCKVAEAFSFEFPNVIPCLFLDLPWARELGDPQAMQLFLDDLAPDGLRRLIQAIGPSMEEGNIPISVFNHPGYVLFLYVPTPISTFTTFIAISELIVKTKMGEYPFFPLFLPLISRLHCGELQNLNLEYDNHSSVSLLKLK